MSEVKQSLRKRYTTIFGLLLAGLVILFCLINVLCMKRVYVLHKQHSIIKSYNAINYESRKNPGNSDDFTRLLERLSSINNIDILIMDEDTNTIQSTGDQKILSERLLNYIFNGGKDSESIYTGDKYVIQISEDEYFGFRFMELIGTLSNDNIIVMRAAVESVDESAILANKLIMIIGAAVILVGYIITRVVSRRVTKPIMNLAKISEKMTNLDFSEKYSESDKKNEIDVLGGHINKLSMALERTIEELKSANIELQKDIEKKEEIDKMRTEFVSNVSHELKTPIALIQGYAEGLKDCVNDDAESRDFYCDVIMDEADKMNKLVKGLLELNELESGADDCVISHFDISELIKNCISAFDVMAKQYGVKIIQLGESASYVWADEFKVELIMNNYLSNAIHYAKDEKEVKVTVSKLGNVTRISVFNSGDAIDDEVMDKLWTKFYKVDKARTRSYGGSGIGLSLVKAAVNSMNGKYGVSNCDGGVEFYFELDSDTMTDIVGEVDKQQ